jgi:hypothetical protein
MEYQASSNKKQSTSVGRVFSRITLDLRHSTIIIILNFKRKQSPFSSNARALQARNHHNYNKEIFNCSRQRRITRESQKDMKKVVVAKKRRKKASKYLNHHHPQR